MHPGSGLDAPAAIPEMPGPGPEAFQGVEGGKGTNALGLGGCQEDVDWG